MCILNLEGYLNQIAKRSLVDIQSRMPFAQPDLSLEGHSSGKEEMSKSRILPWAIVFDKKSKSQTLSSGIENHS